MASKIPVIFMSGALRLYEKLFTYTHIKRSDKHVRSVKFVCSTSLCIIDIDNAVANIYCMAIKFLFNFIEIAD